MKKVNNDNTESWEQELQGKLGSHVSDPPAGLWDSITKDVKVKERPRPVFSIRRWAVAAAAVALIALTGEMAWIKYAETNGRKEKNVASVQTGTTGWTASAVQPYTPRFEAGNNLPKVTQRKPIERNERTENDGTDCRTTLSAADDVQVDSVTKIEDMTDVRKDTIEVQKPGQSPNPGQKYLADNSYQVFTERVKRSQKNQTLNVSLSASGIPADGSPAHNVSVISSDPGTGLFVGYEEVLKYGELQQDVYQHHYPLKVGLSLAWQFTGRFAVESGINYTYLHSTVTRLGSGQNTPVNSSVNYLGIPVSLSYRIWQYDRFSIYSGIGAEAAKSLQGKQWQFSTMLSMGVQYDLNTICGIYLQPSVDYYFDNHSNKKTYYSEHPLIPSLQVGLRFNIK